MVSKKLHETNKQEIEDPVYRTRWDYLRFQVSPSSLVSIAQGEECPQKEMAREIVKIMYEEVYSSEDKRNEESPSPRNKQNSSQLEPNKIGDFLPLPLYMLEEMVKVNPRNDVMLRALELKRKKEEGNWPYV